MNAGEKREYMLQALELAREVKGSTHPNPAVGAIIVKDGAIVGSGATQPYGFDHAEVVAIKEAGTSASDASMVVSLEPCNHIGATPACTDGIIDAGISEVVIATTDDNELVAGKGIERLRSTGIRTEVGTLSDTARKLNEDYNKFIRTGLPFVSLKLAQSLDGKIATRTGESKWISNEASRLCVHKLRKEHCAVLVGIDTVLQDDPLLTMRLDEDLPLHFQPTRIVLDSHLRIPLDSQIVQTASIYKTIIFTLEHASSGKARSLAGHGIQIVTNTDNTDGSIDVHQVIRHIAVQKLISVLIEGGRGIATSFLRGDLVDKLFLFVSPIVIGGGDSVGSFSDLGIGSIKDAIKLKNIRTEVFGDDTLISGYL